MIIDLSLFYITFHACVYLEPPSFAREFQRRHLRQKHLTRKHDRKTASTLKKKCAASDTIPFAQHIATLWFATAYYNQGVQLEPNFYFFVEPEPNQKKYKGYQFRKRLSVFFSVWILKIKTWSNSASLKTWTKITCEQIPSVRNLIRSIRSSDFTFSAETITFLHHQRCSKKCGSKARAAEPRDPGFDPRRCPRSLSHDQQGTNPTVTTQARRSRSRER